MSRALNVWYQDRKVGRLLDSGGGRMAFIYDGDWLDDGWALSCSLPVAETGDFLPPDLRGHHFFANLLPPGGWNLHAEATGTSMGMVPLCVLVTGASGNQMLYVKDRSRLNAPACLVHSNRDIEVEGSAVLTAAAIHAVTTARGLMTPEAGTDAAPDWSLLLHPGCFTRGE